MSAIRRGPARDEKARRGAIAARGALVAGLALGYLSWISRGDLTGWLPGGQATALALAGALAMTGGLVLLVRAGLPARWWAALRAAPASAILLAILLLAAVPRLVPLPGVAPTPAMVADERAAIAEAARALTTGELRPADFARPTALGLAQTAVAAARFLAGVSSDRWRELSEVRPDELTGALRGLSALLGLLAVALTYACGARLAGRRAGLLAAALLAASPLAWLAASAATEEALVGVALLAALWAIAGRAVDGVVATAGNLPGAPNRPAVVTWQAAFLVGLATGVRPSLILLVLPLAVVAHPHGARGWGRGVALFLLAGVAGFLVATPFLLAALPAHLDAAAGASRGYDLRVAPGTLVLLVRHLPAALASLAGTDPLLVLAGGIGGVVALGRRRRADWLLLAFALPSFALALLHRAPDLRDFVPYAPLLALLGGLGLDACWAALPRRGGRRRGRRLQARSEAVP